MDCDTLSKGLFVVGTGTDIGKTYVTGLLLKYIRDNGYNATYFKAALSGAIKDENDSLVPGDAVEVLTMVGLEEDTDFLVPYIYETAVSPHLASQIEGNPVDLGVLYVTKEKTMKTISCWRTSSSILVLMSYSLPMPDLEQSTQLSLQLNT